MERGICTTEQRKRRIFEIKMKMRETIANAISEATQKTNIYEGNIGGRGKCNR